ncbi:MAG: DUF362 domain-containing protein [Prevotellaceae bacterium]|jgi:uncharacterized protein (DUF362 family)|nr:DUF362 domain-containing protein [Prevotellaceae bacterium]
MERRNFLRTLALGSVASMIQWKSGKLFAALPTNPAQQQFNDLVAVMGGEPAQLYAKVIASMGGIGRFVKKGQSVVIKPNIGWNKTPELAADTNPLLISAIIKDCLAAGASEVGVFDHTCDEWRSCYKTSGIEEAVKAAGGKMLFAHEEKYYREVSIPNGKRLKNAKVHEAILDYDVWINVPILKNHGGAKMTISLKNSMGVVWDRRYWHSNDLQQCIADFATFRKKPALNIVDAYRIMTQNGPQGKGVNDVQLAKAIFMSTDPVAVDTAAVAFFSQYKAMTINDASHIKLGEELKVGTTKINELKVERIKL